MRSLQRRYRKPAEQCDLILGRKTYEIFAAYWPYYDETAPHGGIAKLFKDIKLLFTIWHERPSTQDWRAWMYSKAGYNASGHRRSTCAYARRGLAAASSRA